MSITLALILAGVAAAIVGPYVLMIRSRKATYRKMAQALNADYVSQGAFATGKITGTTQARRFFAEPFTTRGIIKNSATIQKILETLGTFAGHIEAAPIL